VARTQRSTFNILDGSDQATCWVRLHTGELPILWTSGREYNPDFLVIEADHTHWVVEVKADKDLASADVQGKCRAAKRSANHVTAAPPWSAGCGVITSAMFFTVCASNPASHTRDRVRRRRL
jgi:hypothetical protein